MVNLQSFILVFCCIAGTLSLCAQSNKDTIRLHAVEITASRSAGYATGCTVSKSDSATAERYMGESLADLLKQNSCITIKDYGPAEIATATFRGTAATQTGILWNGFLINSPNLALCDLSLVPAGIADEVNIYHGGSSAVNGNAAMGGLLSLDCKPGFFRHLDVSLSGSYGEAANYFSGISLHAGNNRVSSRTQIFYNYDNNKFHFINTAVKGHPEEELQHARAINYGLVQQFGFKLCHDQELDAGIWYQVTGRQQSPLMTSYLSEAVLKDSILRCFISYHKKWNRIIVNAGAARFDEIQHYDDTRVKINSTYITRSYKGDVNGKILVCSKLNIDAGMAVNFLSADIKAYDQDIHDRNISFYSGINYEPYKDFKLRLNLRKEMVCGSNPPLVPAIGLEYAVWKGRVIIKTGGGKHYNLPSLNDKYWQPGGDLYLKPEVAISGDAGIVISPDAGKNLKFSCTVFKMLVNNRILWYPDENTGIYKATNLNKVNARGIETSLAYDCTIRNIACSISGEFEYTRSTSESPQNQDAEALTGKQLIYVPFYNGNINAGISYSGFSCNYQHSFTGLRYTDQDNRNYLPAFSTAALFVGKKIKIHQHFADLFLKINNLWNEQYQEIRWHAMPMRNFTAGFRFTIGLRKKIINPI